jgi:thioredoxin-related protein
MDVVFSELSNEHTDVVFKRVEAEEIDVLTEKFGITSVPTFVFLKVGGACMAAAWRHIQRVVFLQLFLKNAGRESR